jgi:hypothetical protein
MSKSHRKSGSGHHRSSKHHCSSEHDEQENPTEIFPQTLCIIVYRGDPVDSMSNRHTAFFIEYSDGSNVLCHIVGGSGFFEIEERWNIDPSNLSRSWERTIPVVTAPTNTANDLTMRNTLYNTPINNAERAWNCQSWVGDGLRRLQEAELIPENIATTAADQMVDVLMEAPDED